MAVCTPWIEVWRSSTICEIATFMTLVSSTITNCAEASIARGTHLRIVSARSRRQGVAAGRDPEQRADTVADARGYQRRRRRSGMAGRDAHAQDAGAAVEAQRRIQLHGLAVDPGGHRLIRFDLEDRRGPLAPQPRRMPFAVFPRSARDRHPEPALVDPRPCAGCNGATQPVAVVGDEDCRSVFVIVAAGARPMQ